MMIKKIFSKEFIKGSFKRLKEVVIGTSQESRNVTKSRFLYWYIILGSVFALIYFVVSLFVEALPWHYAFTPVYLFVAFIVYRILARNRKLIWLYITDMEQGKLLLYLDDNTHFDPEHKMRLLNWVYLKPGTVRMGTYLNIQNRVIEHKEVSDDEKKLLRRKPVACPQQLRDGWNEAMLVKALIHAHFNIQVLDQDLRDEMKLTDEHMMAFDISEEYKKATNLKYQKKLEIGRKNSLKEEESC